MSSAVQSLHHMLGGIKISSILSDGASNVAGARGQVLLSLNRGSKDGIQLPVTDPALAGQPPQAVDSNCYAHGNNLIIRHIMEHQFADWMGLCKLLRTFIKSGSYVQREFDQLKGSSILQIKTIRFASPLYALKSVIDNWRVLERLLVKLKQKQHWKRLGKPVRALYVRVSKLFGRRGLTLKRGQEILLALHDLLKLNKMLQAESYTILQATEAVIEIYGRLERCPVLNENSKSAVKLRRAKIVQNRGFISNFDPKNWKQSSSWQEHALKMFTKEVKRFSESNQGIPLLIPTAIETARDYFYRTGEHTAVLDSTITTDAYWKAHQHTQLGRLLYLFSTTPCGTCGIERIFSSCSALNKPNTRVDSLWRDTVVRWATLDALRKRRTTASGSGCDAFNMRSVPESDSEGDDMSMVDLMWTSDDSASNLSASSDKSQESQSSPLSGTEGDALKDDEGPSRFVGPEQATSQSAPSPGVALGCRYAKTSDTCKGNPAPSGGFTNVDAINHDLLTRNGEMGLNCVHLIDGGEKTIGWPCLLYEDRDDSSAKTDATSTRPTRRCSRTYFVYYHTARPPSRSDSFTLGEVKRMVSTGSLVLQL